jgi:hypothetical protein
MDVFLPFQFNPTEVARTRNVDYTFSSAPGSPIPTAMFKGIQGDSLTLTLLFDAVETYEEKKLGTTAQRSYIEMFTSPDFDDFDDDIGQFTPPPRARLGIGEESWDVVVLSAQIRDVRQNDSLHPTRTWVDIQMRTIFTDVAALRARYDFLRTYADRIAIVAE